MIDSYSKLDLEHFYKINEIIVNDHTDNRAFNLLAVLNDCTVEDIMNTKFLELQTKLQRMKFLSKPPIPKPVKKIYELKGKRYTICLDYTQLTTAQYIDFQATANQAEDHFPEFLACIMIPEGKGYNEGYTNAEAVADIKTMNVEDALGVSAFFLHLYKRLIRQSRKKFHRMLKEAAKEKQLTKAQIQEMKTKVDASLDGLSALVL